MAADPISTDLVRIALDRVEGTPFERFVNDFYPAIAGGSYVPLGGYKDGGADAFEGRTYQDSTGAEIYYQASVEQDAESKIRRTVHRLCEFGREPKKLIYVTSRSVKFLDTVESSLTNELDVTVTIRDGNYIASHINDGPQARAAFDAHLRHYTDFLKSVGAANLITSSKHVRTPAVYVFLAHELERRHGNEQLVDAMTDALALWALEGTDPDLDEFRSAEEVLERIVAELPSVRTLVEPRLRRRLEKMASKGYRGGRAVNWHRSEDQFCLPYKTRQQLEVENAADEALRLEVLQSFDDRIRSVPHDGLGDVGIRQAAEVALRSLQLAFEREGLEFASFLQDASGGSEYTTITDSIKAALEEASLHGKRGQLVGTGAFTIVRGVLYDSREPERAYLQKLSRTYALLFTLNTEPRLIEFFQDMAGDFYLYVGTDVLVRALSEHYLAPADQMTRNSLLIAARNGAKLVLTGPALEEVVGHLRACDNEYNNHIAGREAHLTYELARSAPHILLRAYLYARLNPDLGKRQPRNWPSFVQLFCDYGELHKPGAFDAIRRYLQLAFNLEFRTTEELQQLSDPAAVDELTDALEADKRDRRLAHNDALLALAVYGRRKRKREESSVSEFGFQTWWLTGETSILRHTRELVKSRGARYVMRPDFLLNFLTLAPGAAEARDAFSTVFPSLLGIKLARRMDHATFHKIMGRVAEAETMDDARRTAAIARICDQLKSDFHRQYALLNGSGTSAATLVDHAAARYAKLRE